MEEEEEEELELEIRGQWKAKGELTLNPVPAK